MKKRKKKRDFSHLAAARETRIQNLASTTSDSTCAPVAVDETRELRQKSPVNYSENGRLIPFSEQLGTTSRGLQHAVNDVFENIHAIAPEASGKRYDELMAGLIHHPEFQMALQAQGMPSRADFLIAEGVVWQLGEIRQEGVARHYHGRGAANSIARAAACRVNELAEHGDRTSVAARLNYTARQLHNIISRMEEQTIIDLLDPTRDERSDALSTEDLLLVEAAWEIFTDQDPTLTININAGDGHSTDDSEESTWKNAPPNSNRPTLEDVDSGSESENSLSVASNEGAADDDDMLDGVLAAFNDHQVKVDKKELPCLRKLMSGKCEMDACPYGHKREVLLKGAQNMKTKLTAFENAQGSAAPFKVLSKEKYGKKASA